MRRNERQKNLIIVVLIILVFSLTIGFAAFSNTLTISSSAIVSPDSGDFDINIYGLEKYDSYTDYLDFSLYTSTSISVPRTSGNVKNISSAKISSGGNKFTISGLSGDMVDPESEINYYFAVKNEGKYDAYIDLSELDNDYFDEIGVCTPGEGTTPELVEQACQSVIISPILISSMGGIIDNTDGSYYKLSKGETIVVDVLLLYSPGGVRADGDFSVEFPDFNLEFTSVPPSE